MKVNFKVKMNVIIEFLVEIYFRNDLHFFEKYFTWGNIQPSRDFFDTLYIVIATIFVLYKCGICNIVKNCLPNVCLNSLCVNNNINNSNIPQVVTYVPHAPPLSVE